MSISTDDRIAGPFSSGTVLPFDFKVFTTSDVRVVKTQADGTVLPDLVAPTDYSVTLNPDQDVDAGGEVTLVTSITGGASVVVTSDIPNTQPTTITNLGGFLPATLNATFDRLCIQIQQLSTKVRASLQFPVSDGNVNTAELPTAAVRANKYLAFDASGDVVVNDGPVGGTPPSSYGEGLIQVADATAAKTYLEIPTIPYTVASASGPASLEFAEDTDNGGNKVTLKAPATLAANADVTLPESGALATTAMIAKTQDFRLSLTTGVPVTTADVTGATTVRCVPYVGNQIALYDGTNWNVRTSAEFSLALGTLVSGRPYDVFCYDNAGTPTLEFTAWTNDTTRATALVYQDGVLVRSGATTRRYLGTFYTTSTTTTEDSDLKRYVWNYYNRVDKRMRRLEATASWVYSTAAYRQSNAAAANQVDFVQGVSEDAILATAQSYWSNSTATNRICYTGIGLDSTTVNSADLVDPVSNYATSSNFAAMRATYNAVSAAGKHSLVWLEYGAGADTQTWRGANAPAQSGITGMIKC